LAAAASDVVDARCTVRRVVLVVAACRLRAGRARDVGFDGCSTTTGGNSRGGEDCASAGDAVIIVASIGNTAPSGRVALVVVIVSPITFVWDH
jgi:hypothetical protein